MLCECVREVDIWFTYISAYVLIYWAGFVVISCEDNAGSWCDVTDHDVDPFPTLINFADGRETLTGCAESILDHWFIHSFIAVLFSPNQEIDFNRPHSFFIHHWAPGRRIKLAPYIDVYGCLYMFVPHIYHRCRDSAVWHLTDSFQAMLLSRNGFWILHGIVSLLLLSIMACWL